MKGHENVRFECPCCKHNVVVEDPSYTLAMCEGATMDCPHPSCGALLLVKDGKAVEFHEEMSTQTNGRWPADGAGTSFIEF